MQLYFVRHGESEANIAREFSNRGLKHPLTARGVAQAEALARRLAGRAITRIFSSPLQRAMQTAEILAAAWGLGITSADALREWDVGIYEGTTGPEGWALHSWVQEEWLVHGRLDARIPGGESFHEIAARFVPFLEGLTQGADEGTALLVGHGGLYTAMLPHVLRNIDYAFVEPRQLSNTAYVLAETTPGGLCCREWDGVAVTHADGD